MNFREAREKAIKSLIEGKVQHEARDSVEEKNLLKCGDLSSEEVIKLLKCTRATQHKIEPHVEAAHVEVHYFEPEVKLSMDEEKYDWHIKLYFLDPDVFFISVHRSHVRKKQKTTTTKRAMKWRH